MADIWGNYTTGLISLAQITPPGEGVGGSGGASGAGSPETVLKASPGATYVDTNNGDLYVKQTGTGNTGWVIVTGGSAATQVFSGHYAGGTPSQTPTAAAAIAIDLDAPYAQWTWDGAAWF